jgi:hypothetical protein
MAALYSFHDRGRRRYAIVRMDNGDAVYITVAKTGVLVRYSRIGFFGPKLYESTTMDDAATTAGRLQPLGNGHLTPPGMDHPLLKSFTKAVLRCSTVAEVSDVLNGASDATDLANLLVTDRANSEGVA